MIERIERSDDPRPPERLRISDASDDGIDAVFDTEERLVMLEIRPDNVTGFTAKGLRNLAEGLEAAADECERLGW